MIEVGTKICLVFPSDSDFVIPLYKDEKGMPFLNFKIVNAKNLKMEF